MVDITIDGRIFQAEEGKSLLEVMRTEGIKVPYLCYHPALKPSGSCKLCSVEVVSKTGRQVTMLSCIMKVRNGLNVKTQSEAVHKARAEAFKNLLQMAPQSLVIRKLAQEYGIEVGPPPDGCIRCRLCIGVCKEIVGANALKMEKLEGKNFVVPTEGLCIGCGTCVNVCPTKVIQLEDRNGVRILSIRDRIIGRHIMERCEACGKLFATRKFLNHVAQRTTPHPDVKEHHLYCPTCAKLFSDRIKSTARIKLI
jgi:predicted molibdopterin-dependent oxidoreductase YjgC